jgi:hypothetical protein
MRRALQFSNPGYRHIHLRRQVVWFMAQFPDVCFNDATLEQIRGSYGVQAPAVGVEQSEGEQTIGPFSVVTYLRYMLQNRSWIDQVMVRALSIMWGLRVTILDCSTLNEFRFRHDLPLGLVDMVLCWNGRNHFFGAGK